MDFSLDAGQEKFRRTVREFAAATLAPIASDLERQGACPSHIINAIADLGLLGCQDDYVGHTAALMEISRVWASLAAVIAVHNSLVCYPILRFGDAAQQRKFLPLLTTERQLGCYAFAEPAAGSDAGAIQTTAVADGDQFVLNGQKLFVTNGRQARLVVVYAMTNPALGREGLSAFLVETDTPGFSVGSTVDKLGLRAAEMVELSFHDCRIPKENLLGGLDQGFALARSVVESGRIDIAAMSVGIAQGCLDESVAHATERRQFGRPIAEFEAVQWMIADMSTEIDAARLLTYRAAGLRATQADHARLALQSAMAKLFASEAANRAAYNTMQIFGGHGYLTQFPVERYFRDARAMTLFEETSEIQRLVIERELAAAESDGSRAY